jgi:hypothetical protein
MKQSVIFNKKKDTFLRLKAYIGKLELLLPAAMFLLPLVL